MNRELPVCQHGYRRCSVCHTHSPEALRDMGIRPPASVCFASKCWGKDYHRFLSGALSRKSGAVGYPFDKTVLVVNNGVPREAEDDLSSAADLVLLASRTKYEKHAMENPYFSGEFTAVTGCRSDYICFVQGDCVTTGGDWVTPGIRVLESEPDVMVVSPLSQVNTWHDKDGYDRYMSDQAFLARVSDFLVPEVYKVPGTDPDYPAYGGESFEHRVGKYLKKTGKKRKILTEFYTAHPTYG